MHRKRRPQGEPFDVHWEQAPPPWALQRSRNSASQSAGLRYERLVHLELLHRYDHYVPSPWFSYMDSSHRRWWIQPDGLLVDPWMGVLVLVEIKLKHCAEAWDELSRCYAPVLRTLFPTFNVECVEVCRWFDPAVACSRRPALCEFPDRPRQGEFNVHILYRR